MSAIDRRAFVAGFLAVTVAGCSGASGPGKPSASGTPSPVGPPTVATTSCMKASPNGVLFRNNGCWVQEGNQWVFVLS
jgi:hypothetical protein